MLAHRSVLAHRTALLRRRVKGNTMTKDTDYIKKHMSSVALALREAEDMCSHAISATKADNQERAVIMLSDAIRELNNAIEDIDNRLYQVENSG